MKNVVFQIDGSHYFLSLRAIQNATLRNEIPCSSKTAPRVLIFSTAIGAKPSFFMKFIVIYAPAFFRYNNPVLATVPSLASVTLVQSNPFPQQTSSSATPIGGILHGSSSIGHPGELVSAIWGQPERLPTLRLYTPAQPLTSNVCTEEHQATQPPAVWQYISVVQFRFFALDIKLLESKISFAA